MRNSAGDMDKYSGLDCINLICLCHSRYFFV